jgi:hypothetical protein
MVISFLRSISARHNALKERIHAFRIPLSPAGQKFMGFVYFTIPIIGGYYVMQWAQSKSIENIGSKGEKLELSLEAQRNKEISKKLLQDILNTKQSSRES